MVFVGAAGRSGADVSAGALLALDADGERRAVLDGTAEILSEELAFLKRALHPGSRRQTGGSESWRRGAANTGCVQPYVPVLRGSR